MTKHNSFRLTTEFMPNVFAVTTYYRSSEREQAAEAWKQNGVVALGWPWVGDLEKFKSREALSKKLDSGNRGSSALWSFLNGVKKGDLILAYATRNTIAYVGTITGKYEYETSNRVGLSTKKGGLGYPHQRRVKWWSKPLYFSRKELPMDIAKQIGLQGQTIVKIELGNLGFDGLCDFLRKNAHSFADTHLTVNEDTVKAGIMNYLHSDLNALGLRITHAEHGIQEQKRPDFLALDKAGNIVIIECKAIANENSVKQVKGYIKKYKKNPGTRAILVAFRFSDKCQTLAEAEGIDLYQCNLGFKKL
jgi:predicted Mrr-cat superfamily restriction endonuclease